MGGFSLDPAGLPAPAADPALWEKLVRKVRTGVMPPPNAPQPPPAERRALLQAVEKALDAVPLNPGRTESLRRLNRTEYQNAIRDLLAVDIDATMTVRGTTLPLPLQATVTGLGNDTIHIVGRATIDRTRWGVSGNMAGMMPSTAELVADTTFVKA